MKPGIYGVFNTSNGRAYIGATGRDVESRLSTHRCELRRNKHHTPELQSDWNEYGEGSFEFKVIEVLSDPHSLPEREQYWMDYYSSGSALYNLTRKSFRPSDIKDMINFIRPKFVMPVIRKAISSKEAANLLGLSNKEVVGMVYSGELEGRKRTIVWNSRIDVYLDSIERYDRKRQIPPLE